MANFESTFFAKSEQPFRVHCFPYSIGSVRLLWHGRTLALVVQMEVRIDVVLVHAGFEPDDQFEHSPKDAPPERGSACPSKVR